MKVEIIKNCPSCGSELKRVKDQLFCINDNCNAVNIKKVEHFAKTLKIMGLGIKTIEKLNISNIEDIYNLTQDFCEPIIGKKISTKLIAEIEKSKEQTLSTYLTAFSIPLFGKSCSIKLADIVDSIDSITFDKCKEAGIGDKATTNLLEWLILDYEDRYSELPITIINSSKPTKNDIVVCISGKLKSHKTKAEAEKVLLENNISVSTGISKKVNFLITEEEKESSKVKKAREYNIPIVTMEELLRRIN